MGKRIRSLLLCLAVLTGMMTVGAGAAETTTGHAVYWNGKVVMEGHRAYFAQNNNNYEAINYNGNVYVPLFVLDEWLPVTTQWDPSTETIKVTASDFSPLFYRTASEMPDRTRQEQEAWLEVLSAGRAEGFDVTVLTGAAVIGPYGTTDTVNAQGLPLFPIVYQDMPYLSVRTVAELSGKTVCFVDRNEFDRVPSVYLYDIPSAAQIEAARRYLEQAEELRQSAEDFTDLVAQSRTLEELHQRLIEMKVKLLAIKEPSIPSIRTLAEEIYTNLWYYGVDREDALQRLEADIVWSADDAKWNADPRYVGTREVSGQALLLGDNYRYLASHPLKKVIGKIGYILEGMATGELR